MHCCCVWLSGLRLLPVVMPLIVTPLSTSQVGGRDERAHTFFVQNKGDRLVQNLSLIDGAHHARRPPLK